MTPSPITTAPTATTLPFPLPHALPDDEINVYSRGASLAAERRRQRTDFFRVPKSIFNDSSTLGNQGLALYLILCHEAHNRTTFVVERQHLADLLGSSEFKVLSLLADLQRAGVLEVDELTERIEVTLLEPETGEPLQFRPGKWFWINNFVITHALPKIKPAGLTIYARLACGVYSDDQICELKKDEIAKAIGFAGRSGVHKPLRTLEAQGLIAMSERYLIYGGERWEKKGQSVIRNGMARQTAHQYHFLDVPEWRAGARFRSAVGQAAFNVFQNWSDLFRETTASEVKPSLKPQEHKGLRSLIELVVREEECRPEQAGELVSRVMEREHESGFPLPNPDTISRKWNWAKARTQYCELKKFVPGDRITVS